MTSYRYFQLNQNTTNQTDRRLIGRHGGNRNCYSAARSKTGLLGAGLTTTITPTLTNDVHYSYLRNFWQWGTDGRPSADCGAGRRG